MGKKSVRIRKFKSKRVRRTTRGTQTGTFLVPSTFTVMNGNILPDRLRTKLSYGESYITTTLTTLPYTYVFNGNNAFDPDQTSTGHSPLGWTQLAAFYKRYVVTASKLEVTVGIATSTGTVAPVFCAIHDSLSTTTASLMSSVLERARVKYKVINTGSSSAVLTKKLGTKRVLGLRQLTDSEESDTSTGAPINKWYWHLYLQNIGASDSTTLTFTVRLKYDVEFFERIPIAQS